MQSKRLTLALTVTAALLLVSCCVQRKASEVSSSEFQDSRVAVRTEVVRDTVYIEHRDSSLQVTAYGLQEDGTPTKSSKLSAVSKILKWIFWILVAIGALVIIVKLKC